MTTGKNGQNGQNGQTNPDPTPPPSPLAQGPTGLEVAESTLLNIYALDVRTCDITVCIASTSSPDDAPRYRRINVSEPLLAEFRAAIRTKVEDYKREWRRHNHVLHKFEVTTDLAPYEVEHLDLASYPSITTQLTPLERYQDFAAFMEDEQDFIEGLRFYVVIVQPASGQPVYCFREYTRRRLLAESTHFGMRRLLGNQHLYDTVTEPIFLFDSYLDCISRGNDMFILNKDHFYSIFRFKDELQKTASAILAIIEAKDLIHNFDLFSADCMHDHHKLLKLKNISLQPYLDTISIDDMKRIIELYSLRLRTIAIEGKEKVLYEQTRDRWEILNLLDDTYLDSPMSRASYRVRSKRPVQKRKTNP